MLTKLLDAAVKLWTTAISYDHSAFFDPPPTGVAL